MPIKTFMDCLQQKLNTSYPSQNERVSVLTSTSALLPTTHSFLHQMRKKFKDFRGKNTWLPTLCTQHRTSPSHPLLPSRQDNFYQYTTVNSPLKIVARANCHGSLFSLYVMGSSSFKGFGFLYFFFFFIFLSRGVNLVLCCCPTGPRRSLK